MRIYSSISLLFVLFCLPLSAQAQCQTRFDPYTRQQVMEVRVPIKVKDAKDPTQIDARFYRRGLNNFAEFTITAPHFTENSRISLNDYFGIQFDQRRGICFVSVRAHYAYKNPDGSYSITFTCNATYGNFMRLAENPMLGFRYTMQGIEYDFFGPIPENITNELQRALRCWKLVKPNPGPN